MVVQFRNHQWTVSSSVWLVSLLGPIVVTLLGYIPNQWISHSTLLLLYLMPVLGSALLRDWLGVCVAALLSFLLFNYYHTQPRYSFLMHDTAEIVSALVYFLFALLVGAIAYRARQQLVALDFQRRFLKEKLELLNAYSQTGDIHELSKRLSVFSDNVFFGTVKLRLNFESIDSEDFQNLLQVIVFQDKPKASIWQPLVQNLNEHIVSAVQREHFSRQLKQAERLNDEERLRNALLSSVSHDLKTPLVTMLGSATTLRDLDSDLKGADRLELLDSIIVETHRLEAYIQNLLDMTRLGHGGLSLHRQWVSVDELVHSVRRRIHSSKVGLEFEFSIEPELPPLWVHAALIEQALFNAIDNSIKAAPEHSIIKVMAYLEQQDIRIIVCDQGAGIPESEWNAVFDQFYTFKQGDWYKPGSGLGLTICRGMIAVHGGDVRIVPAPVKFGFCLQMTLPVSGTLEEADHESEDSRH